MKNLKRYLFIGFTLSVLSCANKNPGNCEKVKFGDFYYFKKKTREKVNVTRMDNAHIETDALTGKLISKDKVQWKDECRYDLYVNALSDTKLSGGELIMSTTPAHVEITEVNDSFYVCNVHLKIYDKEIKAIDTLFYDRH